MPVSGLLALAANSHLASQQIHNIQRANTSNYQLLPLTQSGGFTQLPHAATNRLPRLFNRPGVAGAVLQTPSSLIDSDNQPFPPNLQNIINHKP